MFTMSMENGAFFTGVGTCSGRADIRLDRRGPCATPSFPFPGAALFFVAAKTLSAALLTAAFLPFLYERRSQVFHFRLKAMRLISFSAREDGRWEV
jgi:hypothetical protein